jgi:hypothetical protein
MDTVKVTTRDSNVRRKDKKNRRWYLRPWFFSIIALVIIAASVTSFKIVTAAPTSTEPPEMDKVLKAQESTGNFGILIPGYLPKGFDRGGVDIQVAQNGPAGEPAVDMTYRKGNGDAIFLHQWVPVNPDLETLNGSRIIQTQWGKSYLLTEGLDGLIAVWVDIGPLRISISSDQTILSREQLVMSANTLGLASTLQAFTYVTDLPQIKDVVPPAPFEVPVNAEGIQELNLTITPGGFSPIRFAVKQDIPVKVNFRALGDVGCGNSIVIPTENGNYASLTVTKTQPLESVTFTPHTAGNLQFNCSSNHFRGVMTVRPAGQK